MDRGKAPTGDLLADVRRAVSEAVPRMAATLRGLFARKGPLFMAEMALYAAFIAYLFLRIWSYASARMIDACRATPACAAQYRSPSGGDYPIDLSDSQFRMLRENAGTLLALAAAHTAGSWLMRHWVAPLVSPPPSLADTGRVLMPYGRGGARLVALFHAAFGAFLAHRLHGAHAFWPLALYAVNFVAARAAAGAARSKPGLFRALPAVWTWSFAAATLACAEWYRDAVFSFAVWFGPQAAAMDGRAWRGPMRWEVAWNLALLRVISYNMDLAWSPGASSDRVTAAAGRAGEEKWCEAHRRRAFDQAWIERSTVHATAPTPAVAAAVREHALVGDVAKRTRVSQPGWCYADPVLYAAHALYPPLALAGPILSFNAFVSQLRLPQRARPPAFLLAWAARLALWWHMHHWLAHAIPGLAVASSRAYRNHAAPGGVFSPLDIGCLGYATILLMWSKFVLIWRSFRLWAMADGVDCEENMAHCISNHYTLSGFWRSWHRSYNRWLVRYLYVPIGGRHRRLLAVVVVFTFVAVWHDMTLRLLLWGWLLALAFVPETLAGYYFSRRSAAHHRRAWYWRHLVAAGGACNIFMLVLANLIGFSVGAEGVADYVASLTTPEGLRFVAATYGTLFVAVHIMQGVRLLYAEHGACKGRETARMVDEVNALADGTAGPPPDAGPAADAPAEGPAGLRARAGRG